MESLRSLAIAAVLSTVSLALGAEEAPPADAPALTIFSDKAWDYFSRDELHAEIDDRRLIQSRPTALHPFGAPPSPQGGLTIVRLTIGNNARLRAEHFIE